jgi:hypothetical protein
MEQPDALGPPPGGRPPLHGLEEPVEIVEERPLDDGLP